MDHVDWSAARFFWNVFEWMWLVGVAIFAWFRTRNRVREEAIEEMRERVAWLDKEVSKRTGFKHLEEVKQELERTNRRLAQVSASLEATTSLLNRMHEYLLTQGVPRA